MTLISEDLNPARRGSSREFIARALVLVTALYALPLGATYNGILMVSLRQISMVWLTAGFVLWQIVSWLRPANGRVAAPLGPALAVWAGAYTLSAVVNWSGRVEIGAWYAALYAGVWIVLSDLRQRGMPGRWLTNAALITSVLVILFALLQVLPWLPRWWALDHVRVAFAPPRPSGTLGNPNPVGTVMAMLIPFGLARMRWAPYRLDRLMASIWLLLALLTLYLTYSRGAWLALAAALFTLVVLNLQRQNWLKRIGLKWRIGGLRRWRIVVLAIALGVLALVVGISSISSFRTPRRDVGSRLAFYDIAWNEFRAHPLTGTGPFTFGLSILRYQSIPPDQPHAHAHNLIFNVAAEFGLPGLLALGLTVGLIAYRGWSVLRTAPDAASWGYASAGAASTLACGVHSMVDMTLLFPSVMLLVILVLAAWLIPPNPAGDVRSDRRLVSALSRIAALLLWGGVLVTGWWSTGVYADFVRGQQLLADRDYEHSAQVLAGVADRFPSLVVYRAEEAFAYGLAAYYGDADSLLPAIEAYQRALELEEPYAVWWANLAALYDQAGRLDEATQAMQRATEFAPDSPDMWLNLGLYYERQGLSDQAQAAYHWVLELDSQWGHARFWSQTALRQTVRASVSIEPTPYMQAQTLWDAGQPDAALEVLNKKIRFDPVEPRWYCDIARLYLADGQLDRAHAYLDAARVLAQGDLDHAWIEYVAALIAREEGDLDEWNRRMETAYETLHPATAGQVIPYGRDVINLQFFQIAVSGTVLPQVQLLGPDPILNDLLSQR